MSDARAILEIERELARLKTLEIPRRQADFAARYVTTGAGQQFTNSTTVVVDFGTLVYDDGGHVTTGAAWRYDAEVDGLYGVKAATLFASTTAWALGEAGSLLLYKNGALYSVLARVDSINSAATAQFMMLWGSDDVSLVAGDYIDIRLSQTSGAGAGFLSLHADANFNRVAISLLN